MNLRNICFLYLLIVPLCAGEIDTTVTKIQTLNTQIDSLCTVIQKMDREISQLKQGATESKSEFDELLAMLNNEDVESVSPESRSRRKRVDALLKAIIQQPGQLRFNGGLTTILQGGLDKNQRRSTGTGSFDIYASTSFGPATLIFFDMEAIGGNGPDEFFPTFSGLNDDAGSTQDEDGVDRLTVLEAWAEFTLLNKIFTITAGKIDLTNYFDNNASANDETTQFISGLFVNSAAFAVPGNAPGFRLRTTLLKRFHFQLGLSKVNNAGSDLLNEIYRIGSISFTAFPESVFESNFRFYGYQHPLADYATGWGISFDNVIFGSYNIFARYGQNDKKVADFWGIRSAWSAGTRFIKNIAGKSMAVGLAFGENSAGIDSLKNEQVLEIYGRRQLNKWTHISPHLQVVWNARGSSERILIFAIRTHFNF